MKKIIIIGPGGAGKSTLAKKLAEKLKIEVYHLDKLCWKPNWISVSKDEKINIQTEIIKKDAWIIDGNYSSTMDIRLQVADTVIFLDLPRLICIYRVLIRYFKYRNKSRPDMREGCKEKIDFNFLKWIWTYPKNRKPKIIEKIEHLSPEKEVIILKTPKQVRLFLENIS